MLIPVAKMSKLPTLIASGLILVEAATNELCCSSIVSGNGALQSPAKQLLPVHGQTGSLGRCLVYIENKRNSLALSGDLVTHDSDPKISDIRQVHS